MGRTSTHSGVGRAILGAFAIALIIKIFIFDFMIAEGHSMTPAIKPGTILVVCKVFYGLKKPGASLYILKWKSPKEGEIVVFYTPLGEIAVKRCGESPEPGFFYALGDNESHSYDSRDYGLVSYNNIIGRVLGIK